MTQLAAFPDGRKVWPDGHRTPIVEVHGGFTYINRRALWLRDEGVCPLCRCGIDWEYEPSHRLGPTPDHIIPISLGGPDEDSNLRIAHLVCNIRRGNRMVQADIDEYTARREAAGLPPDPVEPSKRCHRCGWWFLKWERAAQPLSYHGKSFTITVFVRRSTCLRCRVIRWDQSVQGAIDQAAALIETAVKEAAERDVLLDHGAAS